MMFIYRICYDLFFWMKRLVRSYPQLTKVTQLYEYYFSVLLNRKYVAWFEKHPVKWGLNTKPRKERYTVSLTSFPARINYVHIAIETIMRQTYRPDRIVLWLSESQFPDKYLPDSLTKLVDRGLTIRWCDDLRSHKKYFYAFQEFQEDNIILVDDDLFYPRDTIARLILRHKKYPKDIVCISAQIVAPAITSLPSVWPVPIPRKKYVSCWEAQAFTGAGSLFPAGWYPAELFDKKKIMDLAGTADDLWLKAVSITVGVKTTAIHPLRGFPVGIAIPNNVTLFSRNSRNSENLNDKAWEALIEEFKLNVCGLGTDRQ